MSNLKIDGFLGISFGSSADTAKRKMADRAGSIFDEENSSPETLIYTKTNFGGREAKYIILVFINDKLCRAVVHIDPGSESKAIDLYKTIKDEINKKYFITVEDYETYDDPYAKDDGYTISAIALGKASFSSFWCFKNPGAEDDYISLKLANDFNILINYEDGNLIELLVKKNQGGSDTSKDY